MIKESAKLIRGAVAGFLVLQISAFVVYLALLGLTNSRKSAEIQREMAKLNGTEPESELIVENIPIITLLQIISLVLGTLITIAYVVTIVTYVRSLSSGRSNRH